MPVATNKHLMAANEQVKLLQDLIQNNELRQQFNETVLVDVTEIAPAFIKRICDKNTPVIVLCIKREEDPFKLPEPVIEEKPKKDTYGLEVTGNPLPAPFTSEHVELLQDKVVMCDVFEEEKIHPLNIYHARQLLAMYSEAIKGLCKDMNISSEDICPVYVPCDGSDGTKVSLLQTEANGTRVNSYMFATQQYKCGVSKMKELRHKSAIEMMNIMPSQSKINDTEVQIDCCHQMEYFGMQKYIKLGDDYVLEGSGIQIKLMWNETSRRTAQLDSVPPGNSLAILEAPLDYEHKKYQAPNLHDEIILLKALGQLLDQQVVENNQEIPAVPGDHELAKPEAALDLLQYASTQPFENARNQQFIPSELDKLIDLVEKESRPNMDITDFMWNAFKHCKTVGQISSCMEAVFQKCITQTPTINPSNNSKVAKIIKAIPLQEAIPFLFIKLAAELLLEIGFIKLARDIQFLCDASGAYGPNDALAVCGYNLTDWKVKIEKIEHAVQCIELVLQGNSLLSMNSESMNYLLNAILTMPGSDISVHLKASHVMNLIQGMSPQLRRWTLKPECKNVASMSGIQNHTPQRKNRMQSSPDNKHKTKVLKPVVLENKTEKHFLVSHRPIFPWIKSVEFELTESDKPVHSPTDSQEKNNLQKSPGYVYCTTVTHNINY